MASWVLIACATAIGQAPVSQALLSARTAFLTLDRESKPKDLDAIARELQKWGHFTLVDAPEKADIVLRLEERPGMSWFGLAAYSPKEPNYILWSAQFKRIAERSFSKQIVKALRKRIEKGDRD